MRYSASVAIIASFLGARAHAQYVHSSHDSISAAPTGQARGMGMPIFAEGFETFDTGPLVPQDGWDSQFPLNAEVTEVNPISGARSVRHASDGTSIPGFEVRSPEFDGGFNIVSSTIRLSGTGSTYQLVPRDTVFGLFNTRVSFDPDGNVRVSQPVVDGSGDIFFDFIDTGFDWLLDTNYRVSVQTFMDGSLSVGINGSEIFSGLDGVFVTLGIPGEIGQFNVWAGNEGTGAFDGTGDTLTLDNLVVGIPSPGAFGVVAMGGLLATRRRR